MEQPCRQSPVGNVVREQARSSQTRHSSQGQRDDLSTWTRHGRGEHLPHHGWTEILPDLPLGTSSKVVQSGLNMERAAWRAVVEQYPCETCGAWPGQPCITTSGAEKQEPHVFRSRLASQDGWRLQEGSEE